MSVIDGKELQITPAGFADVMTLKKALSDALRSGQGINIDLGDFKMGEDLETTEIGNVGNIIEVLRS